MRCSHFCWIMFAIFFLTIPVQSDALDLEEKIAGCFPKAPAGFSDDEVGIESGLGNSLFDYLQSRKVIEKPYEDDQERMIMIEIVGSGLESYKYALAGQTPGCEVIKVGGRKAVVMYDIFLALMVSDKVVVTFSGVDDYSQDKARVLELVEGFDFDTLERLIN